MFVDDDNFLEPSYIASAIRIARENPTIGAFGGIAAPQFESTPANWKLQLLKYLAVRDHGAEVITSKQDSWGPWEPIGAGMVVRRAIALRFAQWVCDLSGAENLGRSDRHLMSGDDALFSRAAHRMGFATSYQPALRLTHYIKSSRLSVGYLARLISGHGRTHVLMNLIMETPVATPSFWKTTKLLGYRLNKSGPVGLLLWSWDLGFLLEYRRQRHDPRMNASQPWACRCTQE